MCQQSATPSFTMPLTRYRLVWTQGAQKLLDLNGGLKVSQACWLCSRDFHRYLPPPVVFFHQSETWSTTVPRSSASRGMSVMFSGKYQSFGRDLSRTLKPYSNSEKFFSMGMLRRTMASIFALSLYTTCAAKGACDHSGPGVMITTASSKSLRDGQALLRQAAMLLLWQTLVVQPLSMLPARAEQVHICGSTHAAILHCYCKMLPFLV